MLIFYQQGSEYYYSRGPHNIKMADQNFYIPNCDLHFNFTIRALKTILNFYFVIALFQVCMIIKKMELTIVLIIDLKFYFPKNYFCNLMF